MKSTHQTQRLFLNELTSSDAEFIFKLVNTPGWIKFIGDRNIKTTEDAKVYIQKIIDNPTINYWVVKTRDPEISIGIITFIKRDYLDHPDIGFAFLPEYTKQGFAYESTNCVLSDAIKNKIHSHILAITIRENINSIKLLERLGFHFKNETRYDNEMLLVYSLEDEKLL